MSHSIVTEPECSITAPEGATTAEQSKDDVLSVTTQIVSGESGVAAKGITRETTFAQDLDADSLDLLTITTQVGEHFGVTPNDSLIPTLPTVGALVDLVTSKKA